MREDCREPFDGEEKREKKEETTEDCNVIFPKLNFDAC